MKAVVFGTGRIACGVIGELLNDAGCTITFIGRNRGVVDNLNRHGRFHLRLSDADGNVLLDLLLALGGSHCLVLNFY